MKFIDLTGKRFGRLVALYPSGSRKGGGAIWRMHCDCGNDVDIDGANIRYGRTKSCGCIQREIREAGANMRHGKSRTATHNIWCGMRQRCENPNAEAFADYGARGITVCARWQVFENFLADMGECPCGMSIDRMNNDGPYEPGNCRWADRTEQARNRRITLFYEYDGVSFSLAEWAERIGVPYRTLHHRFKIGKRGAELLAPLRKTTRRGE